MITMANFNGNFDIYVQDEFLGDLSQLYTTPIIVYTAKMRNVRIEGSTVTCISNERNIGLVEHMSCDLCPHKYKGFYRERSTVKCVHALSLVAAPVETPKDCRIITFIGMDIDKGKRIVEEVRKACEQNRIIVSRYQPVHLGPQTVAVSTEAIVNEATQSTLDAVYKKIEQRYKDYQSAFFDPDSKEILCNDLTRIGLKLVNDVSDNHRVTFKEPRTGVTICVVFEPEGCITGTLGSACSIIQGSQRIKEAANHLVRIGNLVS